MGWQINGTPSTLSSANAVVEITDLSTFTFNQIMGHLISDGVGQVLDFTVYNKETGNLFASRGARNGTGGTDVSRDEIITQQSGNQDIFNVHNVIWISGEEKLVIGRSVGGGTAGASNAPNIAQYVAKYVPSPLTDTFTDVTFESVSSDYEPDTNISALGTD